MPTLRCCFVIYTDGGVPTDAFAPPNSGTRVTLQELSELVIPARTDELFGPHVQAFSRFTPRRGFLLALSRVVRGGAGSFFHDARRVFLEASSGLRGFGFDVLRLWPFPLESASEALPDEPLAEDLFSVGFTEMGEHGFRAETVGLSKLDQREVSFEFRGRELLEDAALMCGHLADWAMEQGHRVQHGQSMAYGFDLLTFFAAEGDAGGPFRGWHPPMIQKLLPPEVFPGVGVLEVQTVEEARGERQPLTVPLIRALEQRLILEEYDLTGDAPFHSATAKVRGFVHALRALTAVREEPVASKDSGWRLTSRTTHDGPPEGVMSLAEIANRVPEIIRYLALPPGVRLEWDTEGRLTVDASKAHAALDEDEADDDLD
ncbi:MAG: hypothetical protein JNJ54_26690 [Myxococcaceae bacterium]|nr:hypothetical protein [Myxococcaceae bacterium]